MRPKRGTQCLMFLGGSFHRGLWPVSVAPVKVTSGSKFAFLRLKFTLEWMKNVQRPLVKIIFGIFALLTSVSETTEAPWSMCLL